METAVGVRSRGAGLRSPRMILLAGAVCMGLAAVFVKLADTAPSTTTFFRCALVLPLLAPWVIREARRQRPSLKTIAVYLIGGLLLGTDLALWSEGILQAGAGISTVALNVQIIVVPLLGWLFFRERVPRSYAVTVPVVLIGLGMVSGFLDGGKGGNGVLGGTLLSILAGIAYAAYLFLLGRYREPGQRATQLFYAATGATISGSLVGSFWGTPDLTPGWPAVGWLVALAVVGQILGWFLISVAIPRLSSGTGASILLVQPVTAVVLGAILFAERLTIWQLLGGGIVVASVWFVNSRKQE